MSILSRYIALLQLRMLSLCLGAFIAVYLVVDFLERIPKLAQAHASVATIALFFLCKIPEIVTQVMAPSVLLATLLTLGLFSRTGELTAMRCTGASIARIARPLIVIGFAASVTVLLFNEFLVPHSFQKMRYIEEVQLKKNEFVPFFRRQNIWYREGNYILRARLFDPRAKVLRGVTVWVGGLAPTARLEAAEAARTPSGWIFSDVTERTFNGTDVATTQLPTRLLPLRLNVDDLKTAAKYAEDMGFKDLRRYARKLARAGYDTSRYMADLHAKISAPFASLVMAFLAVPFALRRGRSAGPAMGIAQSLVIGFSYMVVNAVLLSFGHNSLLPPAVAAWGADAIFAAAGMWLALVVQ